MRGMSVSTRMLLFGRRLFIQPCDEKATTRVGSAFATLAAWKASSQSYCISRTAGGDG